MRRRLYGLLGILAAVTATAVVVTELTKGSCSIVCGWQVPFVVTGTGTALAFVFVAAWTVAYEVGRAALARRAR